MNAQIFRSFADQLKKVSTLQPIQKSTTSLHKFLRAFHSQSHHASMRNKVDGNVTKTPSVQTSTKVHGFQPTSSLRSLTPSDPKHQCASPFVSNPVTNEQQVIDGIPFVEMKGIHKLLIAHYFPKVICLDPNDQGRRPFLMVMSYFSIFVVITLIWSMYPISNALRTQELEFQKLGIPVSDDVLLEVKNYIDELLTVDTSSYMGAQAARQILREFPTAFKSFFDGQQIMMDHFTASLDNTVQRPWTILTHAFSHADPGHLLGNSLAFFMFAPKVYAFLGPKRFLGLYIFGALGCYLTETMKSIVLGQVQPSMPFRETYLRSIFPNYDQVQKEELAVFASMPEPKATVYLPTELELKDLNGRHMFKPKQELLAQNASPQRVPQLATASIGSIGSVLDANTKRNQQYEVYLSNPVEQAVLRQEKNRQQLQEHLMNSDRQVPCLGASGSVMAIVLAYTCFFPRDRVLSRLGRIPVLAAAAMYVLGDLSGITKMATKDDVTDPEFDGGAQVANFGHLGGAIAGVLFSLLIWRSPLMRKNGINTMNKKLPIIELFKNNASNNTIAFK